MLPLPMADAGAEAWQRPSRAKVGKFKPSQNSQLLLQPDPGRLQFPDSDETSQRLPLQFVMSGGTSRHATTPLASVHRKLPHEIRPSQRYVSLAIDTRINCSYDLARVAKPALPQFHRSWGTNGTCYPCNVSTYYLRRPRSGEIARAVASRNGDGDAVTLRT